MEATSAPGRAETWQSIWRKKGPKALLKEHWEYVVDMAVFISVLVIFLATDPIPPRIPFILLENLYQYSHPLKGQTIEAWVVPIVAFLVPIAVFCVCKFALRTSVKQLYRVTFALIVTVLFTAAATNCVKVAIARPRPNFVFRCWPDGVPVWSNGNTYGGYPKCSTGRDVYLEHLKSFPSGHSSVSSSGLGFLTYYLLGQTRAFVGGGFIWRFLVSLIPALGAVIIGVSRVVDYWHHPTDVMTGLLIGFVFSLFTYRMLYPGFAHPLCHVPLFESSRSTQLRPDPGAIETVSLVHRPPQTEFNQPLHEIQEEGDLNLLPV